MVFDKIVSMQIQKAVIHNWRSIKDVEIDFENLMIFIGQNNHGKSNVLSALLFFFGHISHSDLDFSSNSEELFVELTFKNLDEQDKSQFQKYLTSDGKIQVRKQVMKGGVSEYHGYCEMPLEDCLREDKVQSPIKREAYENTLLKDLLPAGRITKEILATTQAEYISQNRDSLKFEYNIESSQFLGFKTVAQGIFGELFFVPAVKSASDELQTKGSSSIFSRLLTNVINKMSEDNPQYKETKSQVEGLIKSLNKLSDDGNENKDRPEEINKLEKKLEEELASWNTTIDIDITPPNIDDVFRVGTNVVIDDGQKTDVSRKGNGLQRSLIFALVKSWAAVLKEEAAKVEEEAGTSGRKTSRSTYFIFEEPELYLHPQAQKQLFSSLKDLATSGNQVILTTHSSFFIDLSIHKSICIICKDNLEEGTSKLQCTEDLFENEDEKKSFNMTYWINPSRGELFFAKKVILFEGQTEMTVVPYLAKKIDRFTYDYSTIDCTSKLSIPAYITLLNKFKLKYVVVYDKDHQTHKSEGDKNSADTASRLIEDAINSEYGSSVIFENDIEEEIGITDETKKHKPLLALKHIADSEFMMTDSLKDKISKIY